MPEIPIHLSFDGHALQRVYDEILAWLRSPDTNVAEAARMAGMSRAAVNRIRHDKTGRFDLYARNFICLVHVYHKLHNEEYEFPAPEVLDADAETA